jgi:NADH-quinone oxidoreductase subunit J
VYPLFYTFNFYLFGLIAIAAAITFVTRRSPVAAALWLVTVMFCLAALYVMLDAQFIAAVQVLLYAGAIMVVFLFVVMLLNLGRPGELADARGLVGKLLAALAGLALLAEVMASRRAVPVDALTMQTDSLATLLRTQGAVVPVAHSLFREYLLAFEVTSLVLLVAAVGAVVIGRRHAGDREVGDAA